MLGLVGQEAHLPAYAATSEELEELTEAQAIDKVHALCLVESGYAEFWTNALSNLRAVEYEHTTLFDSPFLIIYLHHNTNNVVVMKHGLEARFKPQDLTFLDDGYVASVPVKRPYNLQLPGKPQFLEKISTEFKEHGSFPLMEIVEEFDIVDRMIDLPALQGSTIGASDEDPEDTVRGFADGWLIGTTNEEFRFPGAAAADIPGLAR